MPVASRRSDRAQVSRRSPSRWTNTTPSSAVPSAHDGATRTTAGGTREGRAVDPSIKRYIIGPRQEGGRSSVISNLTCTLRIATVSTKSVLPESASLNFVIASRKTNSLVRTDANKFDREITRPKLIEKSLWYRAQRFTPHEFLFGNLVLGQEGYFKSKACPQRI
jgi:hypothetical protein